MGPRKNGRATSVLEGGACVTGSEAVAQSGPLAGRDTGRPSPTVTSDLRSRGVDRKSEVGPGLGSRVGASVRRWEGLGSRVGVSVRRWEGPVEWKQGPQLATPLLFVLDSILLFLHSDHRVPPYPSTWVAGEGRLGFVGTTSCS